ncbi:Biotin-lipoyl like [Onishia taeanensis]|uniref:Biotin-lipoyl like n=1 Tax=Onishia taeanensis TaxID=284577 RepID=A0A1G7Q816_9GAMM|nr:HlyD family efflux transporter periplasmic adaptor subunit [Halomonas taeanensis]SDF94656.1 Biotin-lipoyl like [Halomonas taeanensis]
MFKRFIPLLILVLGGLVFLYLKMTAPAPTEVTAEERSWRVTSMPVELKSHRPVVPLYGSVVAPDLITVTAPLAARVAMRPVHDGQRVAEGELLVALDEADVQPPLTQARAEVADLEAQLESEQIGYANDQQALRREQAILDNAQRRLERAQSLASRNLLSQSELDDARDGEDQARLTVANRQRLIDEHPTRLKRLQAQLERARAGLGIAERDAARSRVMAPFDGVITRIEAAPGDRVASGADLLSVYPLTGLELRARVPNRYQDDILSALREGQPLWARVPERDMALRLERLAGEGDPAGTEAILSVAPTLATTALSTEALSTPAFANTAEGGLVRPGSMLSVLLELPPVANTLAVPYSTLYGNDTLYLVNEDDRLERLSVTVLGETVPRAAEQEGGATDEAMTASGERWLLVRSDALASGQRVVTTHLPNAVDGLLVDDGTSAAAAGDEESTP